MIVKEADYLAHYGILRKSGRYPWGSGETQSARNKTFLDTINDLHRKGMTDSEIAKGFSTDDEPFTSTDLRALKSIALAEQRQSRINQFRRYDEHGLSNVAIGKKMGINESSVRSLREAAKRDDLDIIQTTSKMLKSEVDAKGYIDIGAGVENHVGVSATRLNTAIAVLKEDGYKIQHPKVKQAGTGLYTTVKVLAKPDLPYPKVDQIKQLNTISKDGGRSYTNPLRPPTNVSSKKIDIVYDKDGGGTKDGLIEIRPGAKDLDMGGVSYAQVRIAVDGTHYLKGMAVYNADLPSGVDLRFNTNKSDTGHKLDVMKPMEKKLDGTIDLENPFSSSIKTGGQRGALNIVNEAGDWDKWSRNLPTQFLSKQSNELAKTQLNVTHDRRRKELDDIMGLTNPAVRKKLLETYADEVDSAAVHLKAAAIPRQATKVILPINAVKPTEIYAPSFRDGDRVALVRYPHGGTFEIPELTVNNRNPTAKKILGTSAIDAVGIHSKVAERLSGADFDGDTVVVIPNSSGKIKSTPALERLKGFDPRSEHPPYDGMRTIDGGVYRAATRSVDYGGKRPTSRKQTEMGKITNLIADMTVKGANTDELARAVRHSMVVIDAEKHSLDFKSSAVENGIPALKTKYQGKSTAGASTLITKATSEVRVAEFKPRSAAEGGPIDRATGKKMVRDKPETFIGRDGKPVDKLVKKERLAITDDAHTLLTDKHTPIERIYADHSNRLKSLGNIARKEVVNIERTPMNKSAKNVYSKEVAELKRALDLAERNAPLERQAQLLAATVVAQKRAANPNLDKDDLKKIGNQALIEMRIRTGAKKNRIDITPAQWNAIQAGAISNHQLEKILNNSDLDKVRQLATPRKKLLMTPSKITLAKLKLARGYTQAEVADDLGISLTTLKANLG